MKTAHSPGPWTADEKPNWAPWPEAIEIKSGTLSIAWLTANATERERDRADARLIIAAADMLSALRGLRHVIEAAGLHNLMNGVQLGPTVWFVKASDALAAATDAIVKAEPALTPEATGAA